MNSPYEPRSRNWFFHLTVERCAPEERTRLIVVSHRVTTSGRMMCSRKLLRRLESCCVSAGKRMECAWLLRKIRSAQCWWHVPVQWVLASTGASRDILNCSLITPSWTIISWSPQRVIRHPQHIKVCADTGVSRLRKFFCQH